MWIWLTIIALAALALVGGVSAVAHRRRRLARFDEAAQAWWKAPDDRRGEAVAVLLERAEPHGPAWFLRGGDHLRHYRTKAAARSFGMAHHADCRIESAVLLAFACLKSADGEDSQIIDQVISTWYEMKQPDLLRRKEDRLLLNCLASTTRETPPLSPLGRLVWAVVGPKFQSEIEAAVAGGERWRELRA